MFAQPEGRPHTGAYSSVQPTWLAPETCTVVVVRASCPELSRTTIVIVNTPASLYACVNDVFCVNARSALIAAYGYIFASSPQRISYDNCPFSGSLAFTAHVPVSLTRSVVGPEKPEMVGGLFELVWKYEVQ